MVSKQFLTDYVLREPYSKKILQSIGRPKTISQISFECKIPLATVYRRIKLLEKLNFLEVSGNIANGVKFRQYKLNFSYLSHLQNPKPQRILEIIDKNPGICYSELKRVSGYPNGTLSYIVSKLEKNKKLIVKRGCRRTWFFLPSINDEQFELLIHLRKETSKDILMFLLATQSATFKEINSFIKKSSSTISLTLTQLIEKNLVKRIPGFPITFVLTNKKNTLEAIEKLEPGVLDILKDRFTDAFSYF